MNLTNVKVQHKKYGDGVIISEENYYLIVKFSTEEKRFVYPEAISNGYLIVQDEKLYNRAVLDAKINAEEKERIENEKKAERERKEKERLEKITHENGVTKVIRRENIAFKLTYCDGGKSDGKVGFCGPCSKENIEYNIREKGHVWCSVGSKCSKFLCGDIPYSLVAEEYYKCGLCYESTMLEKWIAGAGVVQTGINKGKPLTLEKVQPNSLAILTTRLPHADEADRIIFAMFLVDESCEGDSRDCGYVTTRSKWKLELKPNEAKQILFWNYYFCPNSPKRIQFGSGLFRYMSDVQAVQILRDVVKVKTDEYEREFAKEFLNTFCQKNNITLEEIPEKSGALILNCI